MQGPVAALLGDGSRLHLQHGPIDLVIGVDTGLPGDRQRAFRAAAERFDTVLSELVSELPLLRRDLSEHSEPPEGAVAGRMDHVVRPFSRQGFVTPMAAVAGAVADEVLSAIVASTHVSRAYVNNGGDIALHLDAGMQYSTAIAGLDGADHGRIAIDAASDVRGIATSGQGGRSLSMGIASSVTVLACNAAKADVAATLIANAVDIADHPSITRTLARDVAPDSDLGARLVVTRVGPLSQADIELALESGAKAAQSMQEQRLIIGAALFLRDAQRIVGPVPQTSLAKQKMVNHA